MQVINVEYECCGAKYSYDLYLPPYELIVTNERLKASTLAKADAEHSAEHPECPGPDDE